MAFDAFLKIDGIPGESTDDKHKDWIEILSFEWKRSGRGQALAITVNHGHGVPLRVKTARGTHIPKVTIDGVAPTRSTLQGVVVSDITVGPAADTFTLDFEQKIIGPA